MIDEEMRELDAWLAENVFSWRQVETIILNGTSQDIGPYWWPLDYGDPLDPNSGATIHTRPPRYSWDAYTFRLIKREIERRGWSWMATGSNHHHSFAIWDHVRARQDGSCRTPAGFAPELGRAMSSSEELAGCLALKAAVEAQGGENG